MNEKQRSVSESIVKQMKAHIWITSQARPALINPPHMIAFIPINPGGLLTPGGGYPPGLSYLNCSLASNKILSKGTKIKLFATLCEGA